MLDVLLGVIKVKNLLFEVSTPIGFKIRTTESYWKLIESKHPEVTGKILLAKSTLKMPDVIRRSKADKSVYLFYKKINGYWICVIAKCIVKDGFVITVYLTDKIKEGIKIWPN